MSFLTIDEMKSVMYQYQVDEITESDKSIVLMAIDSAVSEMKSYLNPSNKKVYEDGRFLYDIQKIFSATGTDRDALILELCKDIACYRVCRLSNVDLIYDHVKERYQAAIDWLTKVAEGSINPNLPIIKNPTPGEGESKKLPFRYGSRFKFKHE